jgi:uncharacterized protein YbjT (DUF2867 family)
MSWFGFKDSQLPWSKNMNAILKLKPKPLRNPTVLVLGGYGFIGRHIVMQLERLGVQVLVGTRRQKSALSPDNQRTIELHRLSQHPDWHRQLEQVDVVINTVGILRQRWGETYEQIHHQAVAKLAEACKQRSIRLIHISALGLNNQHTSRFLSSKLRGEQALVKSGADWHLIRPSLVDGEGGYGAKWFRRLAKWPVHFIPGNANGVMAPIAATDLAKAVAVIALQKTYQQRNTVISAANRIYELGGAGTMSLKHYLLSLATGANTGKKQPIACIKIPALLARIVSHVCDVLHLTPFSFGHYELLKHDNLPRKNRLQELLINWNDQRQAAERVASVNH